MAQDSRKGKRVQGGRRSDYTGPKVHRTIQFPVDMFDEAFARAEELGISFSSFVRQSVRRELERKGSR